jgi:hypothetical protein
MSPLAGRFLGRDPIKYEDGWNIYELYVGLSSVDSSGECVKCCCCAENISIRATIMPNKPTDGLPPRCGTWINVTFSMSFINDNTEGDCSMEWLESSNMPVVGVKPGEWKDMMTLMPLPYDLEPWNKRKKTCPSSENVLIYDPAELAIIPGRNANRVSTFIWVLKSAPDCPCNKKEVWASARQWLTITNGVCVRSDFKMPAIPLTQ